MLAAWSLVDKELRERAGRRRTYIYRTIIATVAYFFFAILLWEMYRRMEFGYYQPGFGLRVFQDLATGTAVGLYIIVPALVAPSLAAEKERGSMALLLLTNLSPGAIMMGKLVSSAVLLMSYMMLLLPLLAICYGLGGIEAQHLWFTIALLFVTAVQAAGVAIAASAWCTSTIAAFVMSYILLGLIFLPSLLLDEWVHGLRDSDLYVIFTPYLIDRNLRWGSHLDVVDGIWPLLSGIAFFMVARAIFWKRVFAEPLQLGKKAMLFLDGFFERFNGVLGSIKIIKGEHQLPDKHPLRWRARRQIWFGQWAYIIRFWVITVLPLFCIVVYILAVEASRGYSHSFHNAMEAAAIMGLIAWGLAAVWIVIRSAMLFNGERSRGTLDVLMVMPVPVEHMLLDKLAAIDRGIIAFVPPILTCGSLSLIAIWWKDNHYGDMNVFQTMLLQLECVILLPLIIKWFGCLIGLWFRGGGIKAGITAFFCLAAWILAPIMVGVFVHDFLSARDFATFLLFLSPAVPPILSFFGDMPSRADNPWLLLILFPFFGWRLLKFLRTTCLWMVRNRVERIEYDEVSYESR